MRGKRGDLYRPVESCQLQSASMLPAPGKIDVVEWAELEMVLNIDIPEDISRVLEKRWGDLSKHVLEEIALQGYAEGLLTQQQVGRLLGFRSRLEAEAFLKEHGAPPDYTLQDVEEDLQTLQNFS